MSEKDSISTSGGDSTEWNPDHPIFAPMQAALCERFDRKLSDINSELRFDISLHAHYVHFIESEKQRRSCWRNIWKIWAPHFTISSECWQMG